MIAVYRMAVKTLNILYAVAMHEMHAKVEIPREQFPRSILARMSRVSGVSTTMSRGC